MKKGQTNLPAIVLSILGGITLIITLSFVYMSINGPNHSNEYYQKIESGEIKNPVQEYSLSIEENDLQNTEERKIIIEANLSEIDSVDIKKELINYGTIVLKLYNLHNIPFTSQTPKIQIDIGDISYYLEVINGKIILKDGKAVEPDLKITTTEEELFKIIENSNYAEESLSSGRTTIEPVASDFVLFSKGYLELAKELDAA